MKLRKLLSKQVEYFGIMLRVPNDVMVIATDSDGVIYGYYVTPRSTSSRWFADDNALLLATVDMGDTDWKTTLRYV